MKQKVLFVLLDQFADWECAFLSTALQGRIQDQTSPYDVVTLSLTREPVRSIGGFTVLPDAAITDVPEDVAGVILVGGLSWRTPEAAAIAPLVERSIAGDKVVGAICDATVFLGKHGFLNGQAHTSNTLEDLKGGAGDRYTGEALYRPEQAVRDGRLITANGTGYLEFTREVLRALEAYPEDLIKDNYTFFKEGYAALLAKKG